MAQMVESVGNAGKRWGGDVHVCEFVCESITPMRHYCFNTVIVSQTSTFLDSFLI